ncbi:hypothetical protein MMC16_002589 [Acarospora aff. strigata]|nr:hypothetical protein [Acarospora aff. strigata]
MAKYALSFLLGLQGIVTLGAAKPVEYVHVPQPRCTTVIISSSATQTPPTATLYSSAITAIRSLKCSGCALATAQAGVGPVTECQVYQATVTLAASTFTDYVCEAEPTGPSSVTNSPTTTLPPPLFSTTTPATCYTPTGPIFPKPAKTVDANSNPVPSGAPGIIVRDDCPDTKEDVAECPLLCFAKSFGPNTPLFQCARFYDDVLFHSCSACLPPCDTAGPLASASA